MNQTTFSVTQNAEYVLSVFYNKRTVNLLRTGEKGEILKNTKPFVTSKQITKSNEPFLERGWVKIEHTSVQRLPYKYRGFEKISRSSLAELQFDPRNMDEQKQFIASVHELAYEVARNHGNFLGWEVMNIQTKETIAFESKWQDGKFVFLPA